jgi:GlcNAc-P-P-Und epimerase
MILNRPRSDFGVEPPAGVLVLGGSGFIGSHLASLLAGAQLHFRIGDLHRSNTFPDRWAECDVRHRETLTDLLRGMDTIINLAAVHRDDVRPISRYHETNVHGAQEVCAAARSSGIQKIIFTSSVAVYGVHAAPVGEEGPFAPCNEYGKTKLQAEAIYRAWANEDAARTLVIVRPAVIFGEDNRGNVYNLLQQIAAGRFLMVGTGENVKSMAYVGNVAAFLMHMLGAGPGTHIFNYADGPDMDTMTLVQHARHRLSRHGSVARIPKSLALAGGHVLDAVAQITGKSFPVSAIRVRKFCESTQFLASRIQATAFIRPYSLAEGLDRTIRHEFPAESSMAPQTVAAHGR